MDGTDDGEGLNGDRRVSDGDGDDVDSGEEDSTSCIVMAIMMRKRKEVENNSWKRCMIQPGLQSLLLRLL